MNIVNNVAASAERSPTKTAIKLDDIEISYAALLGGARRVAGWLASLGVQPGDRVAINMPNLPQFPVIYYGILAAGGVVVPMNPLLKDREVAYYLQDSGSKAVFAWEGMAEEAQAGAEQAGIPFISVGAGFTAELAAHEPAEIADREPSDTCLILYTSGTTGKPKGAELSHANIQANMEAARDLIGSSSDDVIFGGLPLFHSFGQVVGMNAAMLVGATLTLLPRFDPAKALEIFERDKVTIMCGVPTMYVALTQFPTDKEYDTSALRAAVSGGASLPVEVLRGFEQRYGCTLLEGYGLSETSPIASFNHRDHERKPGSIGTPIKGVEFRLIDTDWNDVAEGEIGEIAIRGHNVMKGYFNKPEATAEAINDEGWFRTGDLARVDSDGYYFIVDRAKDMIIRGGFNVYPREIEEVLYEHPAVATAAVLGVPDAKFGEEIAAAVTLMPGAQASEDEIREFVKARVAAYKYPRIVWVTDALPTGATGKILKREIKIPTVEG
jgi:long-chain acyl-CoA synthetase